MQSHGQYLTTSEPAAYPPWQRSVILLPQIAHLIVQATALRRLFLKRRVLLVGIGIGRAMCQNSCLGAGHGARSAWIQMHEQLRWNSNRSVNARLHRATAS
ncbi:conserved hypothetical protein [Xanthomonas citri pv. aurantifolii str. ICPB 11122]|nr:conserved hypothetical protein [Xanthomonas citri pv. aurantifolii str. ICPB 11122]